MEKQQKKSANGFTFFGGFGILNKEGIDSRQMRRVPIF